VASTDFETMLAEASFSARWLPYRGEGAADSGWTQSLQDIVPRRHDGQRDPVLYRRPGAARAKAGATFVSPFVGRLDDIGQNGMELIADITQISDV